MGSILGGRTPYFLEFCELVFGCNNISMIFSAAFACNSVSRALILAFVAGHTRTNPDMPRHKLTPCLPQFIPTLSMTSTVTQS